MKKWSSDLAASATPTLVDPAVVCVLGWAHKESDGSSPASKKKRADPSLPPRLAVRRNPAAASRGLMILKDQDEKWSERYARLEAMLVSKMFTVSVNPVQNLSSVVTSDQPLFDPGTSTTGLSSGVTGSSLDQTTGEAAVMREAVNTSASRPVEGPGIDVKQQNATQPVEAPGTGAATQPVEAPGAGPEVLPTSTGSAALHAEFRPVQTVRKNSRVNQDLPLMG